MFHLTMMLGQWLLCLGEVDGMAEVTDTSDADVTFVHSAMSTMESVNDCGSLSVGGMSIFSTPPFVLIDIS